MEMRRALGGDQTPAFAAAVSDVAEAQFFQGYATNALRLLRTALQIEKSKYPATHPEVIATGVRLGEAMIATGEESEAEPLLQDAAASAVRTPYPLTPWQIAEAESALAACWLARGHVKVGEPLSKKSETGLSLDPQLPFRKPAVSRLISLNKTAHRANRPAAQESR